MKITSRFFVPALLLAFSFQSCDNKSATTPQEFGVSPLGSVIGTIESVVVVPYYQDGSVRMSAGEENYIRFEVYPPAAAESIAKAGTSVVSLDYVLTLTKAVETPESIPVTSVSFDGELLVLTADGRVFPEEITTGPLCASARLRISDGTATRSSEYFPLSFLGKMELSCDIVAVDLGLSVLWGDRNLGADSPEDAGDYYAWGELMPHYFKLNLDPTYGSLPYSNIYDSSWRDGKEAGYTRKSYKWYDPDLIYKKYYEDNLVELQRGERPGEAVDDTARAILGGKWRIPTQKEWDELDRLANGSSYSFYSKETGKGIFIPSSGHIQGYLKYHSPSLYWCSETEYGTAYVADIRIESTFPHIYVTKSNRYWGLPIRPVCDY